MFTAVIDYIRSWFTPEDIRELIDNSRKRRSSDSLSHFRSPKARKVLSSVTNNFEGNDVSYRRFSRPIKHDDDDFPRSALRTVDLKSRKLSENRLRLNETDLSPIKATKSMAEKKLQAKKDGFEFITKFSSNLEPITTKTPITQNGTQPKFKTSSAKSRNAHNSTLASPTLDYSIRVDEKLKYQELLEKVAQQSSFNNSSVYCTPMGGSFNRSRRLVELARSPKNQKTVPTIDLTGDKPKLSTKDTVIKILDDFEGEIEDSDSDVEILPMPPSPKPDIKVEPINSLRTVIDTSQVANGKWLDDITSKHKRFLEDKNKEIQAYADNATTLNSINRDILIQSLSKRVEESLAIKDTILPIDEKEEEVELPELTDEQLRAVKKAFTGDPNEILTKKFNLNVTRRDIQTLSGLTWLNDNVINFYMNLIIERGDGSKWPKAYAMNTFFYQKLTTSGPESLRRWTRKVDIFTHEYICVPIHLGIHWCMAIINIKEKTIKYYDSMGKPNNQCLNALKRYLEYEHQDKKNKPFSTEDFIVENVKDVPQQMNGSDCGMFACTFAEFASRKAKFTFQQSDMPYLRKKMVVEILSGQLLIQ